MSPWFTVTTSKSTSRTRLSTLIAVTVAVAVNVSPGQTCEVNLPPKCLSRPSPT